MVTVDLSTLLVEGALKAR